MEKIVFVKGDNLESVNKDLQAGWKVKSVNACSEIVSRGGESSGSDYGKSFAYIVLERESDT